MFKRMSALSAAGPIALVSALTCAFAVSAQTDGSASETKDAAAPSDVVAPVAPVTDDTPATKAGDAPAEKADGNDAATTDAAPADPAPATTPVDAPVEASVDDAPSDTDVPPEPSEDEPEAAPVDPTEQPDGAETEEEDDTGFDPAYGKLPALGHNTEVLPGMTGDLGMESAPTPLGNFMDTRLAFSFSDDNFLAGPGETTPSSPDLDFFPRNNNQLFFDNLNTRNSGYETLSELVVHRRQKGFIPGMDTEAAIVSRFRWLADDDNGQARAQFFDDGSYLRIRYFFNQSTEDTSAANIDLVMFPFNSNRFRLGYLYDISWAGNDIFPSPATGGSAVPAAKLQISGFGAYGFVGAKTARLPVNVIGTERITEQQAFWGGLFGAGYDLLNFLQFDFGGGVFARGANPNEGVQDQMVWAGGASSRVVLHLGQDVAQSIDFRLYSSDPAMANLFSMASRPRKGWRFLAALEMSHLEQTLQDPVNLQSTKLQGWDGRSSIGLGGANAAALSANLGYQNLDLRADAVFRDLAFITYGRPGIEPYKDFAPDSIQTPEFLLALQASYFIEYLHLTPAIVAGVQLPSTYTGFDPDRLPENLDYAAAQPVVIRDAQNEDKQPCLRYGTADDGSRICEEAFMAEPVYALRLNLKWDVSNMLSVIGQMAFLIDNNEPQYINSNAGQTIERNGNVEFIPNWAIPGTSSPHNLRIGGGIFAQARF